MKAIELIRFNLEISNGLTLRLAEGLRSDPLVFPMPGAKGGSGNHAMWTLGHLATIESNVPFVLLGREHPYEKWWPLFAMGTQPKADAKDYPPFDEVISVYRDSRATNLKLLDEIGEQRLDEKPKNVPPGFEEIMTSLGTTMSVIAMHNMFHCGQLADARRALGLKRFN